MPACLAWLWTLVMLEGNRDDNEDAALSYVPHSYTANTWSDRHPNLSLIAALCVEVLLVAAAVYIGVAGGKSDLMWLLHL